MYRRMGGARASVVAAHERGATPPERPVTGAPLVNVQESAARYAFAAADVRALRVLDVASGAGLGSEFLLAQGARIVVGVESAAEALRQARRPDPSGMSFVRADALALPFADASFDAVVSFETIEHLIDARAFVAQCRRVLRRDGRLYLSTPNRTVTRWMPTNPFHVREFTVAELVALVGEYFPSVTCFWQRPVFLPVFFLRQMARRCVPFLPGGAGLWRLWTRIRPRRTQLAATAWQGSRYDRSLIDERYGVRPAERAIRAQPMYTVLVARC